MKAPTTVQYDKAKALLARQSALINRIESLTTLVAAAQAQAKATTRALADRLNLTGDPAGTLPALIAFQRKNPHLTPRIAREYDWLLTRIANPDPLLPGTKPLRIDYGQLPLTARPYVLAGFLKSLVVNGVLPALDLNRSDPELGVLHYVSSSGPIDLVAWRAALPEIAGFLGGPFEVTASTVNTITLVQRTPLPSIIPFSASKLRRGHILYGYDIATRQPIYLPLAALTHTLAVGQSGSGKSVFLNQVLLSLLHSIDLLDGLTLVDLKGGVELAPYAGIDPKIEVVTDYEQLPDVVSGLVDTMHQRLAQLRAARRRAVTSHFHVVVIDEFAAIQFRAFADKDAKQRHQKLLADLNLLAAQARAPGIKLWAQLQKPTADAMDSSFRTNLQSIVAFKISNINAGTIFDGIDDLPVKPAELSRGRYLLRLDGQPDRVVQACFVPDDLDLPRIIALGRACR